MLFTQVNQVNMRGPGKTHLHNIGNISSLAVIAINFFIVLAIWLGIHRHIQEMMSVTT